MSTWEAWASARGLRPRTIDLYRREILLAQAEGDLGAPLSHAQSRSSWVIACAAIRSYLRAAGREADLAELVRRHPAPADRGRIRDPAPDPTWSASIRAAADLDEPARSLLLLVLTSGLRIGDVLQLQRHVAEQVVAHGSAVIDQKGGRPRSWAPGRQARDALRDLLRSPWDVVWQSHPAATRPASTAAAIRRWLAAVVEQVGGPHLTPHQFRHSLATLLHRSGADVLLIQRVLGHRSVQTTQRYVHPTAADQSAAVDAALRSLPRVRNA